MSDAPPPDLWSYIIVFIISLMSGVISVSHRILKGHLVSLLWVSSELLAAVLCGYLMFESYLTINHIMPDWITPPVAVAIAAYSGGRLFQALESRILEMGERLFKSGSK